MIHRQCASLASTLVVLLVCAMATALASQSTPQIDLAEAISLELVEADVVEVLTTVAQMLGASARIDPRINGTISMATKTSSIEAVLDGICKAKGCSWKLTDEAERILRVKRGREEIEPITIELIDADLTETLTAFAVIARGASLQVAPELEGTISVHLDNVPWADALDATCERAGCTWRLEEGTPPTLTILASSVVTTGDLGTLELSGRQRAPRLTAADRTLLGIRFQAPGANLASQEMIRFSLKRPVVAVRSGSDKVWEARLVWISFGEFSRWLMPLLIRCGDEVEEARVVELGWLTLPLTQTWRGEADGASLWLSRLPPASRQRIAGPPEAGCYPSRPIRVDYMSPDGARGSTIWDGPGAYLQIASPDDSDEEALGDSAVAVLVVGMRGDGVVLRILTEDDEGHLVVEEGRVGPANPWLISKTDELPVDLELSWEAQ